MKHLPVDYHLDLQDMWEMPSGLSNSILVAIYTFPPEHKVLFNALAKVEGWGNTDFEFPIT